MTEGERQWKHHRDRNGVLDWSPTIWRDGEGELTLDYLNSLEYSLEAEAAKARQWRDIGEGAYTLIAHGYDEHYEKARRQWLADYAALADDQGGKEGDGG